MRLALGSIESTGVPPETVISVAKEGAGCKEASELFPPKSVLLLGGVVDDVNRDLRAVTLDAALLSPS